MKKLGIVAAGAFVGLLLATNPTWAQGAPQTVASVHTTVDVTKLSMGYRASKIRGSSVYNDANNKVGAVDDLIVNRDDRVLYAVVSVGGFLGMGKRLVAVPYSALKIEGGKMVLPGATKDALKTMPEFKYARS